MDLTRINITLTQSGQDTDTFNILQNGDGFTTPINLVPINKSQLTPGPYEVSIIDILPTTNILRLQSLGVCSNFVDITVDCLPIGTTPTPTSTSTSTSTPTLTPSPTSTVGSDLYISGMQISCDIFCNGDYNFNTPATATNTYFGMGPLDVIDGITIPGFYAISSVSGTTITEAFKIVEVNGSGVVQSIFVCTGTTCEEL